MLSIDSEMKNCYNNYNFIKIDMLTENRKRFGNYDRSW